MELDKDLPLKIYKDNELVAQFSIQSSLQHNDWLEHYKSRYPDSEITIELKKGG